MNKKNLLTTCMSFALVMAFATSGFATVWADTTTPAGQIFAWNGAWSPSKYLPGTTTPNPNAMPNYTSTTWQSGNINYTATGSNPLVFTLNGFVSGTWDKNPAGHVPTLAGTGDYFIIQTYRDGNLVNTYSNDQIDRKNSDAPWIAMTNNFKLDNISGVYAFKAIGAVTARDEKWQFSNAKLEPTPLPGAVWMLGSGLLGFMGFKRARKSKNAA